MASLEEELGNFRSKASKIYMEKFGKSAIFKNEEETSQNAIPEFSPTGEFISRICVICQYGSLDCVVMARVTSFCLKREHCVNGNYINAGPQSWI